MCFEAEAAMCLSVSTEHTFPRKQPSPKAGDYGVIQFVKLALRQTPPFLPTSTTMTRPGDPSISNGSGRAASAAQLVLSVGKMANLRLAGGGGELQTRETASSLDFGKWWRCCWQCGGLHMDTADPAD